jgi:fatty acid desaturase
MRTRLPQPVFGTDSRLFRSCIIVDQGELNEDAFMLWTIAIILLVLWALGLLAFHVAGGLIHLLLVIAVVVVIVQFITGRRTL